MWFSTNIAERADLVVVAAAALERRPSPPRHLHVIDEVAIPDRLEDAVGQSKTPDVLTVSLTR